MRPGNYYSSSEFHHDQNLGLAEPLWGTGSHFCFMGRARQIRFFVTNFVLTINITPHAMILLPLFFQNIQFGTLQNQALPHCPILQNAR
jgi:hypothetical protein